LNVENLLTVKKNFGCAVAESLGEITLSFFEEQALLLGVFCCSLADFALG
jgi:hypothetical protein